MPDAAELESLKAENARLRTELADKVEFNIRQCRNNNLLQAKIDGLQGELSELRSHVNVFRAATAESWNQK